MCEEYKGDVGVCELGRGRSDSRTEDLVAPSGEEDQKHRWEGDGPQEGPGRGSGLEPTSGGGPSEGTVVGGVGRACRTQSRLWVRKGSTTVLGYGSCIVLGELHPLCDKWCLVTTLLPNPGSSGALTPRQRRPSLEGLRPQDPEDVRVPDEDRQIGVPETRGGRGTRGVVT